MRSSLFAPRRTMAKRTAMTGTSSVLAAVLLPSLLTAAVQTGPGGAHTTQPPETVPFSVRVIDFGDLAAPLGIVFRYTALAPGAAGQAEILPGPTKWKINGSFANLPPASRLGNEYLTYVLWCVTPEGRSMNLGEVELAGTDGHVNGKVSLRRFGLIVTAEAYLAVSEPSKAVVFEADVAPGSPSGISVAQVNCEFLAAPIGAGTPQADPPRANNSDEPLVIEEGRRAIAVARAAGAEKYAPDTFGTAEQLLQLAKDQQERGAKRKEVVDAGSEAAFIAEDARVLALTRQKRAREASGNHDPPP